jgi:hypothetical protein
MFHRQSIPGPFKKAVRGRLQKCDRPRTDEWNRKPELLLPGALLVTIQAQLLTTFMFIDLGLAAFFD